MIGTKCPGQDMRYWTADDVHEENCPNCGEIIEFFKTDIRLRCRNCKTKLANPRFDMGCAQWCAHAEMCLGPAAKGLKQKSLRAVLEDEFSSLAKDYPEKIDAVKSLVGYAEQKSREQKVDMLPVITAFMITTLYDLGVIENAEGFLEKVTGEHTMPDEVVNTSKKLADNVINNQAEGKLEKVVFDLINKLEQAK